MEDSTLKKIHEDFEEAFEKHPELFPEESIVMEVIARATAMCSEVADEEEREIVEAMDTTVTMTEGQFAMIGSIAFQAVLETFVANERTKHINAAAFLQTLIQALGPLIFHVKEVGIKRGDE